MHGVPDLKQRSSRRPDELLDFSRAANQVTRPRPGFELKGILVSSAYRWHYGELEVGEARAPRLYATHLFVGLVPPRCECGGLCPNVDFVGPKFCATTELLERRGNVES